MAFKLTTDDLLVIEAQGKFDDNGNLKVVSGGDESEGVKIVKQ